MFRHFIIAAVVEGNFFFAAAPMNADHFLGIATFFKPSLQAKTFLIESDIEQFRGSKITFGKAAIVDGVQQVGLALAVQATDAYHIPGKIK